MLDTTAYKCLYPYKLQPYGNTTVSDAIVVALTRFVSSIAEMLT